MKRFMQCLVFIKIQACILFTGSIFAYTVLYGLITGSWSISGAMIFQFVLLAFIYSILQFIFFSGTVIRTMSYPKRILCALLVFLAVLMAMALLFGWFPAGAWKGWLIFLGTFTLAFGGITLGFEILFRITGQKYDDMLADYKRKHSEE